MVLRRERIRCVALCLLLSCSCKGTNAENGSIETAVLESGKLSFTVTPQFGGRVLGFALKGRDNVLMLGEGVSAVKEKAISALSTCPDYRGHIVWLGPQSEWWLHQKANSERFSSKAVWPQDPFITMADNRIQKRSKHELQLEGVKSSVSGMRIDKHFELLEGTTARVLLGARAENIRKDEALSWDLWFNSRVNVTSKVYVPVEKVKDVRAAVFSSQDSSFDLPIDDGIMALNWNGEGEANRIRGKLFMQPSAGWMAAFTEGQLFIIEFDHQPLASIHPEQGQVELYVDKREGREQGVIEMELHAPYRKLQPGEAMEATQRWSLYPYNGADDPEQHRKALRAILR